MFGPTQVTRRWHRKTNVGVKRYAVASAIAATQVNSLVQAHGHRTTEVPAVPLVIDMQNVQKTKEAVEILKSVHAYADVEAAAESKHKRAGLGAARNRRYIMKNGPMVVFAEGDNIEHGFRALPGVTLQNVASMNLLDLAPGGQVGRFVIWTKKAFESLDKVYAAKTGFNMPTPVVKNTDYKRFFESEAIVKARKPEREMRYAERKTNPFADKAAMKRINPAFK